MPDQGCFFFLSTRQRQLFRSPLSGSRCQTSAAFFFLSTRQRQLFRSPLSGSRCQTSAAFFFLSTRQRQHFRSPLSGSRCQTSAAFFFLSTRQRQLFRSPSIPYVLRKRVRPVASRSSTNKPGETPHHFRSYQTSHNIFLTFLWCINARPNAPNH